MVAVKHSQQNISKQAFFSLWNATFESDTQIVLEPTFQINKNQLEVIRNNLTVQNESNIKKTMLLSRLGTIFVNGQFIKILDGKQPCAQFSRTSSHVGLIEMVLNGNHTEVEIKDGIIFTYNIQCK